jgi:hypothetical protein
MIIELSLTAPEHAPLIEGYHEVFSDEHFISVDWDYPVLPGIGESFDEAYIRSLLEGKVNMERLPHIWTIVDRKWIREASGILPRLYVVGK